MRTRRSASRSKSDHRLILLHLFQDFFVRLCVLFDEIYRGTYWFAVASGDLLLTWLDIGLMTVSLTTYLMTSLGAQLITSLFAQLMVYSADNLIDYLADDQCACSIDFSICLGSSLTS